MATTDRSADEQNVEDFVQMAKESLGEDLLKQPGAVLYSSWETLKDGEYYFLGVNPAGSGEATPKTIRESLDELGTSTTNEYLDVSWYSNPTDTKRRPLQQRFKFLFEDALRVDPRSVCASNLIFKSSKKEKDAGGWPMAKKCWPVHKAIIQEIVQPRVIITFGILPFDFILNTLGGTRPKEEDSRHGNWTWRYSILEETGQKLIGLPHLSIYAIDSQSRAGVVRGISKRIKSDYQPD